MHSEIEVKPAGLRQRIIEEVLCVVIMIGVAATVVLGTPSRRTVVIAHGTASAPLADHGPAAGVSIAAMAGPTEERSFQ